MRAAASIYLSFYDETAGNAAMRSALNLPGDPGVWVALALARRGDKEALARAVKVFDMPFGNSGLMVQVPHGNLRKRVLELLSNSLAPLGDRLVVARDLDAAAQDTAQRREVHALLRSHVDLVPIDPWLDVLRTQKID